MVLRPVDPLERIVCWRRTKSSITVGRSGTVMLVVWHRHSHPRVTAFIGYFTDSPSGQSALNNVPALGNRGWLGWSCTGARHGQDSQRFSISGVGRPVSSVTLSRNPPAPDNDSSLPHTAPPQHRSLFRRPVCSWICTQQPPTQRAARKFGLAGMEWVGMG